MKLDPKVRLLSLDVGLTTGWAQFYDGKLIANGAATLIQLEPILFELRLYWQFDHVVVEPPLLVYRGDLADNLKKAMKVVESIFPKIDRIQPSDWKGTPASKTKLAKGLTQHERDAIRMGLWFISARLQVA